MSNNRFKIGQIIGLFVGVIAGSLITNVIISKVKEQYVVQQPIYNSPAQQNIPSQQNVFEQAVSYSLSK